MIRTISTDRLNDLELLSIRSRISYDYLNMDSIYSDETGNYVHPPEPDIGEPVRITVRTGKDNADACSLITDGQPMRMEKSGSEGLFDFYSVRLDGLSNKIRYHFEIEKNGRKYYYNRRGLYDTVDLWYDFTVIPGFKTPDWSKGAVYYQIYVDRFHNGDPTNDVVNNEYAYLGKAPKRIDDWKQPLSSEDIANFYGGDLQGIIDKMDYLTDLGVEVIYLNPIFVSPSNHKYDIQDYDYVDPHYGKIVDDGGEPLSFEKFHNRFATKYMARTTRLSNLEASNKLFVELVETAHKNGIKIILDGVFNHCGAFNKWMDKENFYGANGYPVGAYRDARSRYHDFFYWYDNNWPNNDCYDSWWGFDNHPKLNFEKSNELYEYIMGVAKKWVSPPFNADGWRLDVAADLGTSGEFNHKFWKDFRTAVKSANPDAIIFAEHYGSPKEWLQGDEWDTIMNYDAFMEPVTWFLTGMEKHSDEFRPDLLCNSAAFESSMRGAICNLSVQSLLTAMNELSNHDHSRFLTRTNMTVGRLHSNGAFAAEQGVNRGIMLEAVTVQFTWPGSPAIYYGDEAGLTGWTDPDDRRPFPWGREDQLLLEYHKEMIRLRKQYDSLRTGSTEFLYSDFSVLSFGRWTHDQKIAVVVNNDVVQKELTIPVWKMQTSLNGKMEILIRSGRDSFSKGGYVDIADGCVKLDLPAFSSIVLLEV